MMSAYKVENHSLVVLGGNMNISDLVIGKVYSHQEVYETFQCGNMGGMRRSKKTNTLILICDHTKGIYDDM